MTIGELFIKLGFKLEGDKDLQAVQKGMQTAASGASRAAIELSALNAAFLVMVDLSTKTAVALRSFSLSTGLSTAQLQLWQHAAAVNGVEAGTLSEAIKTLQQARSDFALGNPNAVGAWTLLGVDPRQDPFKVLDAIRQRMKDVRDVGVARNLLGQVGLEALLPLLRSTTFEWEKWNREFVLSGQQINRLAALNASWITLKMSVASLAAQFSSVFVPALRSIASALMIVTELGVRFIHWLQGSTPLAHALRLILQFLLVDLLFIGAALSGLVVILGTVAAFVGALNLAIALMEIEALPIIILVAAALASLVAVGLLLQDLWVNVKGGKSAFDWLHSTNPEIWALAHGLENIIKLWKELKKLKDEAVGFSGHLLGLDNFLPSNVTGQSPTTHQTNHTEISVIESATPAATVRELDRYLSDMHRGALNQAPVRNF